MFWFLGGGGGGELCLVLKHWFYKHLEPTEGGEEGRVDDCDTVADTQ